MIDSEIPINRIGGCATKSLQARLPVEILAPPSALATDWQDT